MEDELRKLTEKLAPLGSYESETEVEARILAELTGSKEIIESRLGLACPGLSWPFGDYGAMTIGLARQAGYNIAFTTERGTISPGADRFRLKRYRVKAISGSDLALELGYLKNRLLARIIMGRSHSRQVAQEFPGTEKGLRRS